VGTGGPSTGWAGGRRGRAGDPADRWGPRCRRRRLGPEEVAAVLLEDALLMRQREPVAPTPPARRGGMLSVGEE